MIVRIDEETINNHMTCNEDDENKKTVKTIYKREKISYNV